MQKEMIERFRKKDIPVWFTEEWSGTPVKAKIIKICKDDSVGEYAKVNGIRGSENSFVGTQGVLFDKLYKSKKDLLTATTEAERKKIKEIKSSIRMMEDCIKFMFNTTVSCAEEYTDWIARRAIQEVAMERWGLRLE